MADISLKVAGAEYLGWTEVSVTNALNQIAGTFDLSVTDKHPGNHAALGFKMGMDCQVAVNGQPVITGYIDNIAISYGEKQHSLNVSGRDKTADLADCSHVGPPSQWDGLTLEEIAREVCKPFGIEVVSEIGKGEPLEKVKAGEGATVLSFLNRLARLKRVLLVTYGDGKLYLTRAGMRGSAGALELAGNILAGSSSQSNRERFSKYIVKGQGGQKKIEYDIDLTEEERAECQRQYMAPKGEALDNAIKRYRPLVVIAGDKGDDAAFTEKAQWEAATRAGASRPAEFTVQSWAPQGGGVWRINSVVPVHDDYLGINQNMLIERVAFGLSETGGSVSTLSLVHPDTYLAEPNSAEKVIGDLD